MVVPVAYMLLERAVERVKAFRSQPLPPRLRVAARVTTVLIVLALIGAFASVAGAFASTPSPAAGPITMKLAREGLSIPRGVLTSTELNVSRCSKRSGS